MMFSPKLGLQVFDAVTPGQHFRGPSAVALNAGATAVNPTPRAEHIPVSQR